jgi:hypothetical protein
MPEPFKFKTEERSSVTRDSSSDSLSSKPFVFKALPVPKAVIQPPSPPRATPRPLTEPQPFNLTSISLAEQAKSRFKIAVDAELAQEQAKFSSFKAAPVRARFALSLQRVGSAFFLGEDQWKPISA